MKYQNLFYTTNTDYAALLLAMNQTLDSRYWEKGKYHFVFENAVKCNKVIKDYNQHRIIVGAKSLFEAIETVKGMIESR